MRQILVFIAFLLLVNCKTFFKDKRTVKKPNPTDQSNLSLQLAKNMTPRHEMKQLSVVELYPSYIEEDDNLYPMYYVAHKEPAFVFPTFYEAEVCLEKDCNTEIFPHRMLFLPVIDSKYTLRVRQCILGSYHISKKTLCSAWSEARLYNPTKQAAPVEILDKHA